MLDSSSFMLLKFLGDLACRPESHHELSFRVGGGTLRATSSHGDAPSHMNPSPAFNHAIDH